MNLNFRYNFVTDHVLVISFVGTSKLFNFKLQTILLQQHSFAQSQYKIFMGQELAAATCMHIHTHHPTLILLTRLEQITSLQMGPKLWNQFIQLGPLPNTKQAPVVPEHSYVVASFFRRAPENFETKSNNSFCFFCLQGNLSQTMQSQS